MMQIGRANRDSYFFERPQIAVGKREILLSEVADSDHPSPSASRTRLGTVLLMPGRHDLTGGEEENQ